MSTSFDRPKQYCALPESETPANTSVDPIYEQAHGNAAVAEALSCQPMVEGNVGRVFNRILGQAEGNTETADLTFTLEDLKDYFKHHLEFADGEFFRKSKINGAAEAVMEELDHNGDGQVGWGEFQALRARVRQGLAPGLTGEATSEEVESEAGLLFNELNEDGEIGYSSLKTASKQRLSKDTDHKNLVAQLSALLVLDIVDVDQPELSPRDRTLSEEEWMEASEDLIRSG